MKPAIIVHGGAWDIPQDEHESHIKGCRLAVLAGFKVLAAGQSALDAVEAAVTVLEDDPTFDAGIGSHLNEAGKVQLDAGMMDGATWQVGAVVAVEHLRNPIQVARLLLTSKYNMLAGEGAVAWAARHGIAPIDPALLIVPREQARYERIRQKRAEARQSGGTVGAVAIDRQGNLVAGTSTGGTLFKPIGRVGDSPLPGCGYFADNGSAAVSSTGRGEAIMRVQLARTAADFVAKSGDEIKTELFCEPAKAAVRVLAERVQGEGGLIMIDQAGRVGFAHNTPHLARAYMIDGMVEPEVGI